MCQPSTPASYFHLLRQHAYVNFHRPVVIATPKSMLRSKLATSTGGVADGPPPGSDVAGHFAPLKAAIEEIDGAPPLLDDVGLRIDGLAKEVASAMNSPDAEETLLKRGGLAELTGAVANAAKTLPDPLDDWIGGLAGDTIAVTRDAVISQLNDRWRADVFDFCVKATEGRYPFDAASAIDVNVADFRELVAPGARDTSNWKWYSRWERLRR